MMMMEPKAIVEEIYAAKEHLGRRMGDAIPETALTMHCGRVHYAGNEGGSVCTSADVWADIDPDDLDALINELAHRQGRPPKLEYNLDLESVEFVWQEDGERTMDCVALQSNPDRTVMVIVCAMSGFRILQLGSPLHEVYAFPLDD